MPTKTLLLKMGILGGVDVGCSVGRARFSGVRGDHRCGVANGNFPFPVRWPAMWGREEKLSHGPTKGVGVNADLVVFPASIDVV